MWNILKCSWCGYFTPLIHYIQQFYYTALTISSSSTITRTTTLFTSTIFTATTTTTTITITITITSTDKEMIRCISFKIF